MTNYENAKALEGLTLGKSTDYASEYNPNLLQGVPRSLNREQINLSGQSLPFYGEDVWYGYELSWLNSKGKPVVAVAEFRVPATSENIVESKSFKLYLNSFNQSRFATREDVIERLIKDLSEIAKAPVKVTLFDVDNCPALNIKHLEAICIDECDIAVDDYQFDDTLLDDIHITQAPIVEEVLVSHLLKSNCLITNQPDWASVYISYQGKQVNRQALLAYLISFRQHNEFHEQCVERIFCDLQKYGQFDKLSVYARYTRRGGLDINPFRSTENITAPNARTLRQ
ncbi:NADPH-dependent 7-cyano-7-deazaguanine reductase QueF [Thalassotalea sp. LPB0316]|uniref:NADPH-dependent 7-cyano-7-deazaguanine reductase QueF n=1 Tax=Thalassotalea sp. LPB0316 TaxID=2769490 RepID=UPI0018670F58|nr:NADPH-dependent 7-cyano-7-deazaguanine reductase QueF [Thalassotalea sp. LPB0316]QOL24538.1 NADPH-dependent 7-cyano-7-deazaguanine reductase QueF [Thalassotalea sp. LPB0316]